MKKWILVLLCICITSLFGVAEGQAKDKVVIGISNGYYGTDWRTQMVEDIETVFSFYKGKDMVDEIVFQHAGGDINLQIQQSRNLIAMGVDVLMINANSATGCNGVIDEAKAAGIPVVSFDQAVTNPYAINVTNDHYTWATGLAEWMAQALDGKGKVIVMNGLPGHPAAEARKQAALDVFGKHPDIEVLKTEYGNWDNAEAQSVMNDLLAAFPEIDGVFVEDSMATGVYNAFMTAGRALPVMTGDPMHGFLKEWKGQVESGNDFKAYAQANPPGVGASALALSAYLANGYTLKPLENNTYYIPVRVSVTTENLDEQLELMKGKSETLFLDDWLTDEEARALFE